MNRCNLELFIVSIIFEKCAKTNKTNYLSLWLSWLKSSLFFRCYRSLSLQLLCFFVSLILKSRIQWCSIEVHLLSWLESLKKWKNEHSNSTNNNKTKQTSNWCWWWSYIMMNWIVRQTNENKTKNFGLWVLTTATGGVGNGVGAI